MSNQQFISQKIQEMYSIIQELEDNFPGRPFTPDGHMVGSLGEVLVAERYGLQLLKPSAKTHDAVDSFGRNIQIKATQKNSVALSSEPDYIIVIKISQDGNFQEIYNGPGDVVWSSSGKMQKNGQRRILLSKLKTLSNTVAKKDRIDEI